MILHFWKGILEGYLRRETCLSNYFRVLFANSNNKINLLNFDELDNWILKKKIEATNKESVEVYLYRYIIYITWEKYKRVNFKHNYNLKYSFTQKLVTTSQSSI